MKGYEDLEISYRPVERADISMLVEMEKSSFTEVDRFSRRKIAYYIRNPHRSIIVDVIEAEGEPKGYAVFLTKSTSRSVSLHSICIAPETRGKGIAKAYLEKRLAYLGDRYERIVLRVRTSNLKARDLYSSLSFSVDGIEPGYYPDGDNAIRMTRKL